MIPKLGWIIFTKSPVRTKEQDIFLEGLFVLTYSICLSLLIQSKRSKEVCDSG